MTGARLRERHDDAANLFGFFLAQIVRHLDLRDHIGADRDREIHQSIFVHDYLSFITDDRSIVLPLAAGRVLSGTPDALPATLEIHPSAPPNAAKQRIDAVPPMLKGGLLGKADIARAGTVE